ncbi:MAG: thermonuclease [Deltaproteobacteria bacterium]|nr:MAG: thermonuclease [Deltaproteobacteria bacterium]
MCCAMTALVASGCGGNRCGPSSGTVDRVIDGDTIELEDGTRVRYLLIDAPENTGGHVDCYGPEATAYNRALVEGRRVSLGYDVECTDRYGRLLAWVEVDGQLVNARMVEQGYACVYYIPPNGEQRRFEFENLEARARAEGRGMWGACAEVTCEH